MLSFTSKSSESLTSDARPTLIINILVYCVFFVNLAISSQACQGSQPIISHMDGRLGVYDPLGVR